jgi:hypothetical protein
VNKQQVFNYVNSFINTIMYVKLFAWSKQQRNRKQAPTHKAKRQQAHQQHLIQSLTGRQPLWPVVEQLLLLTVANLLPCTPVRLQLQVPAVSL